jgi:hypothetical protein
MNFRVVRDGNGKVVCFGPNDGSYEPSQPWQVEEELPNWEPSVIDQLNKLDTDNQLTQRNLRSIVKALTDAATGVNIDIRNVPEVKKAIDAEAAAVELRKQISK